MVAPTYAQTVTLDLAAAAVTVGAPDAAVACLNRVRGVDPANVAASLYPWRGATARALPAEQTLRLWGGPHGHYTLGVAAAALTGDPQARDDIRASDTRKHVVAALTVEPRREPRRAEKPSGLAAAVLGAKSFTEELAVELVGADNTFDRLLAWHRRLPDWPALLRRLVVDHPGRDTSPYNVVEALVGRDDLVPLLNAYPDVIDAVLVENRYHFGRMLAGLPGLPERVYETLTREQECTGVTADPEWAMLAANPDVPSRLLDLCPAAAGTCLPVARLLVEAVGDSAAAFTFAAQLLCARTPMSAGDLARSAAAVMLPAAA